jgi:hypothetical protein
MKKTLIALALAVTLAGCSAPRFQDGYQLGDFSATAVDGTVHVLTLQARYCAESDPVARAILLRMIRVAVPGYPADGLCTDLLDLLEEDQTDEIP